MHVRGIERYRDRQKTNKFIWHVKASYMKQVTLSSLLFGQWFLLAHTQAHSNTPSAERPTEMNTATTEKTIAQTHTNDSRTQKATATQARKANATQASQQMDHISVPKYST